jgi:L-alanine-DL-glutamate epimerase-like enolase superfamily enzyme
LKIEKISIIETYIPFKIIFKHFLKSSKDVKSIIIRIQLSSGVIGYGEAVPREYVTGENTASIKKNLERIIPDLLSIKFSSIEEIISYLKNFRDKYDFLKERDLCVQCCLELALLDAIGKYENKSVISYLGEQKKNKIEYSAVVTADTPIIVKQLLKRFKNVGLRQYKLKVGKSHKKDIENIALCREIVGEKLELRVDANASWTLDQAKCYLDGFSKYGIISCEQPLPVNYRSDYPKLFSYLKGKMHISLDESLCSYNDAKWFIDNYGADLFNLRISKCGGLFNTQKILNLARENNIHCQLGAQVGETSLLSNAGRILACHAGDLLFHEGSFGTNLLARDLTKKPTSFGQNGLGTFNSSLPGLGVNVDDNLLNKISINETNYISSDYV